jgi:hypothetical protein
MHLDVVSAHEWLGEGGYWFRVEVWRDERRELHASSYRRERGNWLIHNGQQMAMARRYHLKQAQETL